MSNFSQLGIQPHLIQRLSGLGIQIPTPVQEQSIPLLLDHHDVLACAQTGTGKTAAFGLPMIQMLTQGLVNAQDEPQPRDPKAIRALVLTPTRELAQQVFDSITSYAEDDVNCAVIYGGVSMKPQLQALKEGVELVVATPGRLLDHLFTGSLHLNAVEFFVLDEADRMLDMGFMPDLQRIMRRMNAQRQSLLFSATFSDPIKKIAQRILNQPKIVQIAAQNQAAETVTQMLHPVDQSKRPQALSYLIGSRNDAQVLVFVKTKQGADQLVKSLKLDGLKASSIHGDKSQGARHKALDDFKNGKLRILVATDVAARGLDISALPLVINYELPYKAEDYIHRIGRTGRAGETGVAISFMTPKEEYLLEAIERLLDIRIPQSWLTGFEPSFEPEVESERTVKPKRGRSYEKKKLKAKLKIHAGRGKAKS
ncbi:MAG: DEAD/DEAH box helicase [Vibrio sp.]